MIKVAKFAKELLTLNAPSVVLSITCWIPHAFKNALKDTLKDLTHRPVKAASFIVIHAMMVRLVMNAKQDIFKQIIIVQESIF